MATSNQQKKAARLKEFSDAAKKLSDAERRAAMEELLDTGMGTDEEAGIMRQLLAEPEKPLTGPQRFVFDNYIEPAMVERCSQYSSCNGFTMPGVGLCPSCAIRFG